MCTNEYRDFAFLSPISETLSTFSPGDASPNTSTTAACPTDNFIKRRHRLKSTESAHLNQAFAATPFPSTVTRRQIAQTLGMSEKAVQVWFQNRRAKQRRDAKVKGPTLTYSRTKHDAGEMEKMSRDWGLPDSTFFYKSVHEGAISPVMTNSTVSGMNPMHIHGTDSKHFEDWLEESERVLNVLATLQSPQSGSKQMHTFRLFDGNSFESFPDLDSNGMY